MIIVVDFDYTLFNTKRMREALRETFLEQGVSEDRYREAFALARDTGHMFSQDDLEHLIQLCSDPAVAKQQVQFIIATFPSFIYDDSISFLTEARPSHTLILLSYGDKEFQELKIHHSGLRSYVDQVIVTPNVKKDEEVTALSKDGPVAIIDDNPQALAAVKNRVPEVTTILMRRSESPYKELPSGSHINYEVENFTQVKNILS